MTEGSDPKLERLVPSFVGRRLNRRVVNVIRYVLEDLLPPVLRDSVFFYWAMHLLFRRHTRYFTAFRTRSPYMSALEYDAYYRFFPSLMSETDLNDACIERLISEVRGETYADVGCGRGYFAGVLARRTGKKVTASDFIILPGLRSKYPDVTFVESDIERLPYADKAFDTVICTHSLEHIVHFDRALAELRRVYRRRLMIVVPREREYRYSFNLHVNFFPYPHSLLNRMHPLPQRHSCEVVAGDFLYIEDRQEGSS